MPWFFQESDSPLLSDDEAMRRIEFAHEYTEEQVARAVLEALRGEHGQVARLMMEGFAAQHIRDDSAEEGGDIT